MIPYRLLLLLPPDDGQPAIYLVSYVLLCNAYIETPYTSNQSLYVGYGVGSIDTLEVAASLVPGVC